MRQLAANQISELVIYDLASDSADVIFGTNQLIEAPNWTLDGQALIYNAGGRLYRMAVGGDRVPTQIDSDPITDLNNDHVLDPNGTHIYVTSNDGHLYHLPLVGGTPKRVSRTDRDADGFRHYLHGVSPDGETLAYVGLQRQAGQVVTWICTLHLPSGETQVLTDGARPVDGPEFSPDGEFIYYNSEQGAMRAGHAQIYRMNVDGTGQTALTSDDRVNWFPHPSPDGTQLVYLSYPPDTIGHPADRDVLIMLMDVRSGQTRVLDQFNGGQGTINVNSWSPCGTKFAYVRYPFP